MTLFLAVIAWCGLCALVVMVWSLGCAWANRRTRTLKDRSWK